MPTVRCPHCSKLLRVAPATTHGSVRCDHCGEDVTLANASSNPDSPESHAGKPKGVHKLGRFEIRRRAGAGAFATVYRAYDPVLDREVALKIPRLAALQSEEAVGRLAREPRAAARLRHPNIVPVFDAGFDGDRFYVASAFIEGRTLHDTIADTAIDRRSAVEIVWRLADALHYAHGQGIIHRDVKPANIMLDREGQPHLMDFGLARWEQTDEKLTHEGSLLGTPAYMSPEQAGAPVGDVGPRSDQYSLGVVLYELLCGRRPLVGDQSVAALLYEIRETTPERPRSLNSQIDRDLETICLTAMAKDPSARYDDCGQLADDLRRWLVGEPIKARPMGVAERASRWARRNPTLASLAAAVALLLLTVALVATTAWVRVSQALHDKEDALANERGQRIQTAEQKERAEGALAQADQQRTRAEDAEQEALRNLQAADQQRKNAEQSQDKERLEREKADAARAEAERAQRQAEDSLAVTETLRREAVRREEILRRQLYAMQMNLAMQALKARNHQRLRQLLDQQIPSAGQRDLRSFEWYYLAGQSDYGGRPPADPMTPLRHGAPVYRLQFSTDGRTLLTFGRDLSASLWNLGPTSSPIARIALPDEVVNAERLAEARGAVAPLRDAFCASPDNRILGLAVPRGGPAHFWQLQPRREVILDREGWPVEIRGPVAIRADCRTLVAAKVFDARKLVASARAPQGHGDAHPALPEDLTRAGPQIGAADAKRPYVTVLAAFDVAAGPLPADAPFAFGPAPAQDPNPLRILLFSPDGGLLAAAYSRDDSADLVLWNSSSRTTTYLARDVRLSPYDRCAFSRDGARFAWLQFAHGQQPADAAAAPLAHLFETDSGKELAQREGPPGAQTVAFSYDSRFVVLWRGVSCLAPRTSLAKSEAGKTLVLWDLDATPPKPIRLEGHKYAVRAVAFAPDQRTVATASEDETIKLWDLDTGFERITLDDPQSKVLSLAFSPDGATLAAGDDNGMVRFYRAAHPDSPLAAAPAGAAPPLADGGPDARSPLHQSSSDESAAPSNSTPEASARPESTVRDSEDAVVAKRAESRPTPDAPPKTARRGGAGERPPEKTPTQDARIAEMRRRYEEHATLFDDAESAARELDQLRKTIAATQRALQTMSQQYASLATQYARRKQDAEAYQEEMERQQRELPPSQRRSVRIENPFAAELRRLELQGRQLEQGMAVRRRAIAKAESELPSKTQQSQWQTRTADQVLRDWIVNCDPFGRLEPAAQQETVAAMTRWIAEDAKFPPFFLARGCALANLGKTDSALLDFQQARQLYSGASMQAIATAAVGYARARKGDARQSAKEFSRAIAMRAAQPTVHLFHGEALLLQDKAAEAERVLEQAVLLDSQDAAARESLARALAGRAQSSSVRKKAAIEHAQTACDQTRWSDWSCLDALAMALAADGQFDRAVERARQALQLAPPGARAAVENRIGLYQNKTAYRRE